MISPNLVVGYHGCDHEVALAVVLRQMQLKASRNAHDWLGWGIYFWQNDPQRAWQWAVQQSKRANSDVKRPAILGAVIDLGNSFTPVSQQHLELLADAHEDLCAAQTIRGDPMPRNIGRGWANRSLDCAVFESMHAKREERGLPAFDTVISYFPEGRPLYPGAGVRQQDHVQVCVRNERRVLGFFLPEQVD